MGKGDHGEPAVEVLTYVAYGHGFAANSFFVVGA